MTPAARWCAVTGGRGFMARRLVSMLLRSGEWRVRVVDLAPAVALGPGGEEGVLTAAIVDGRAAYVSGDVRDLAQITEAFEGVDVVFHTAAPDPVVGNFQLHYSVNVEGTKNVIDACMACKVKRLIYTSSSGVVFDGVYGLFDVNESMPYPDKFIDAYTETKAAGEKLVLKASGTNGLLTCCIRPGNIFGPGGKNIPMLVSSARRGKFTFILGSGKNYDDFVYVDNVAYSHICAEKTLSTGEGANITGGQAYFITNMEPVNMWDFVCLILEELGYKRQCKVKIPVPILMLIACVVCWVHKTFFHCQVDQPQITPAKIKYATLNRTFSCKKANDQLGYKPIVSLKDGLNITLESYHNLRAQKPQWK